MDELTKYVFDWCPDLLTDEELLARRHLVGQGKIENSELDEMKSTLKRAFLSTNRDVLELLKNGEEEFFRIAVERVMRDNPKQEFLNLCPRCNSLARTPKAKQCPKCIHSWHDKTSA